MTCRLANTLKAHGVQKGDRVAVYLPTSPLAVAAMLACARIGAVHTVVFAGFSAEALAGRIQDGEEAAGPFAPLGGLFNRLTVTTSEGRGRVSTTRVSHQAQQSMMGVRGGGAEGEQWRGQLRQPGFGPSTARPVLTVAPQEVLTWHHVTLSMKKNTMCQSEHACSR